MEEKFELVGQYNAWDGKAFLPHALNLCAQNQLTRLSNHLKDI